MLKVWIFLFCFSLGIGLGFWGDGDRWGCGKGLCEGREGVFDSEVSTREVAGKGYA